MKCAVHIDGREKMRNKLSNAIWGIIFIVLGIAFAGNAFSLWNFNLFFEGWWTLLIIVPCSISLVKNGYRTSSFIGVLIGVMLLLSEQNYIDGDILGKLIVPFIFVVIGISMVIKNFFGRDSVRHININYQGGTNDHSAVFAGASYNLAGEKFMGTSINAVFGGVELDLRNAIIEEDVMIHATAVFGGIELLVPSNVRVKVSNVPIFGGVDNKANHSIDKDAPIIYVNSTCMFGGIDIK